MQYFASINLVLALIPALALGAPVIETRQPSLGDISNAQNLWASDTSKVSQFLSAAPSLSGQDLASQAAAALAAEKDELSHKAVLDAMFVFVQNPNSNVQNANNVLVDQKKFQFVIDGLTDLTNNGAHFSQAQILNSVGQINRDRCTFVLPAIDTYFRASGAVLQNGVNLVANRPTNC